jgi:hypothetical protein
MPLAWVTVSSRPWLKNQTRTIAANSHTVENQCIQHQQLAQALPTSVSDSLVALNVFLFFCAKLSLTGHY